VKVLQREAELLEIVGARAQPCSLAGRLHGGQQKPDEGADDGNDCEKFDERKRSFPKLSRPAEMLWKLRKKRIHGALPRSNVA
jgi:hypothetical protein